MNDSGLSKNWVSKHTLLLIMGTSIVLGIVAVVFSSINVVAVILSILSGLMLFMFLFMVYAHYQLSPRGGNLQTKISNLLTEKIPTNSKGRLLDIGCGSGVLSVEIALQHPALSINAVDYWGGAWGYSKERCEQLAQQNKVEERIVFTKASASKLPFEDGIFDIVISNMVFHEVADAKDKREVIREALRPLKKGGIFIFQDQFKTKSLYGERDELLEYIKNLGVEKLSFEETGKADFIPSLLNNPIFFGNSAIISGIK